MLPLPIGKRGYFGNESTGIQGRGYDYARGDCVVSVGSVVRVPLGNRTLYGVVMQGVTQTDVPVQKIKPIDEVADCPPIPLSLLHLVGFVADYYGASPGAVLKMVLSVPDALVPPATTLGYMNTGVAPSGRLTPQRQLVLDTVDDTPQRLQTIRESTGVGTAVIKGLVQAGALTTTPMPEIWDFTPPDLTHYAQHKAPLTDDQHRVVKDLRQSIKTGEFSVTVLDGVTGSGKTEVYFDSLAKTLQQGKQVLILLPEIALSTQWLQRFTQRFGVPPAQWHSDMSPAQRRKTWRAVAMGAVQVLVGARSALFLPFAQLGLIVVDEEHDTAFKQEDGVMYHGRDMAVMRAKLANIPCILASATPSLESLSNVQRQRYGCVVLPSRYGSQDLPTITALDLKQHPPQKEGALSPPLVTAIQQTLDSGQQVLLFLNRRGYAPLTLCRCCGHRLDCPQCDSYLVEHRHKHRGRHLQCHHCGHQTAVVATCPECGDDQSIIAYGTGVERLLEEVSTTFPNARPAVATSETMPTPKHTHDLFNQMESGQVNLLIGTQIIAKGHHFPNLTLVGVVDGDMGLSGGDPRAGERTYQLLQQVAGRAGRGMTAGQVYIQTHTPENPVMQTLLSGDKDAFLAMEMQTRQQSHYPPYGRLAGIIIAGVQESAVESVAADLRKSAPHTPKVRILGPIVPPFAQLRGRHRRRFLVHAMAGEKLQPVVAKWLKNVKIPSSVGITVDIDPYSFF